MELGLDDGSFIRFECGGDGQSLRVSEGEWVDPFAPPLTDENAEYVAAHGAWRAFHVTTEPAYSSITGSRITAWDQQAQSSEPFETRARISMSTGAVLVVTCGSDEVRVRVDPGLR